MNIEKHKAFIDSLDGDKGLPDEWRLLDPGLDQWREGDEFLYSARHGDAESFHWRRASLLGEVVEAGEVGRRPTYRQIPDLKERVMEFARLVANMEYNSHVYTDTECEEMRRLINYDPETFGFSPEVKP